MRVVILAGGKGTRLAEETQVIPKPMLPVGDKPILHHIIDIYRKYGHDDFIIAAGYKRNHINAYFLGLEGMHVKDVIYENGSYVHYCFDGFEVKVINTGEETMTGGRLRRLAPYLTEPFLLTYGDGLAAVNIPALIACHQVNDALVTITAVRPVPRFGSLKFDLYGKVSEFSEKMVGEWDWINGGFFVVEPEALEYISGDDTNWEKEVLPMLAIEEKLYTYIHLGFWHCIDTLRDLEFIREEYQRRGALWLR